MSVADKVAALVLVASGVCGNALGQGCSGQWLPGYGVPGVNGSVKAMTLWDPDGNGPRPAVLVVGGSFTMVGTTPAKNVAMWDGNQWSEVGGGTNGSVNVLATFQGKLYASGLFTQAGGNPISVLAAWDGTTWSGTGIEPTSVNAMLVYQNELVVAGNLVLTGAGATIAKWNGTTWSFLGANSAIGSAIYALAEYQGKLIAAGSFTTAGGLAAGGIAAWDGAWTALGSGVTSTQSVRALAVYGGKLFAAGNFTAIGGVNAIYLGCWNGAQWQDAGLPVSNGVLSTKVNALAIFEGKLIVGGDTQPYRANVWDGVAWSALGQWFEGPVLSFQPFDGSLFAGTEGSYHSTAIGRGLIEYSDGTWQAIAKGFDDTFSSLAAFENKLLLSGSFDQVLGTEIDSIAQWNGGSWDAVGANSPRGIFKLQTMNGLVYAAGGSSIGAFSTWNGETWSAIPGIGTFNRINSLSRYQGDVLTVGEISLTGVSGNRPVAAWTGTQWKTFGTALTGAASSAVEYQGDLIVSGSLLLRLTSNPTARGLFRYDGAAWHAWPVSLSDGGVLAVYQGKLLIGSANVRTTGGLSYGSLAQWEGDHWMSTGGGVYAAGVSGGGVSALKEFNGALVVAGAFNLAGGNAVSNIARWNGVAWDSLGLGVSGGRVVDVQQFGDELIAIGEFTHAGGSPSAYFARWTDDPTPWVAVAPESKPVNEGLSLTLSAAAASGYADVTYRWQRNGADIVDGAGGASAGGGFVSGASGALASPSTGASVLLTISGVQASDAGAYTIVFSNGCNDATSAAAAVSVNTCPGDLNADGVIDDADFTIFVGAYNVLVCEDPSMPVGCPADLNGDGLVEDLDFQVFIVGYDALVCE